MNANSSAEPETAQSARDVSVVVPVYQSAATLDELVRRLSDVLKACASRYEILLIDDASQDASWSTIARLSREWPCVRGVSLMRNFGQHNALLCGVREATGEVIVTLDDDLQHPPEAIPLLLDALDSTTDVVYAVPTNRVQGYWRALITLLTKAVMRQTLGITDAFTISPFRAFRSRLVAAFTHYSGPYVSLDVLLSWGAKRFASVPVEFAPRTAGRSGYSVRRLITYTWTLITGFTTAPLHVASVLGLMFAVFGLGVLTYVLINFLIHGSAVPGFAFLGSVISILGGMQLLVLGVLGAYIARIHFLSLGSPAYVIRDKVGYD